METVNSSSETRKSAWNINGQYAQIIVKRLSMAQSLYDKNNLVEYFKMLDSIFGLTTHNLEEEEIEKMNELRLDVLRNQKYFKRASQLAANGESSRLTNEEKKGKWNYVENIRIYQQALLKVLQTCGFLTNQKNRSRLKFS